MPHDILGTSIASDLYVSALASAYLTWRVYDPGFAIRQDPDIYDKIQRDGVVAGAMIQRRHMVSGGDWRMEPGDATPKAKMKARIFEDGFREIRRFSSAKYNLSNSVFTGSEWCFTEGRKVWKTWGDGRERLWWVPTRLVHVDRLRFRQRVVKNDPRVNKRTVVWEFNNTVNRQWVKLEPHELAWFCRNIYDDSERSLGYGKGLIDAIYFYFWAKTQVQQYGLDGVERWAHGLLYGVVDSTKAVGPETTTVKRKDAFLKMLQKMKSRHVGVIDKADEIKLLEGGQTGWQIVRELLNYHDIALRVLILGSNLPSSADAGGSYALAQVQENSTDNLIRYDGQLLEEAIDDGPVRLFSRLNARNFASLGVEEEPDPNYRVNREKETDPLQRAQVISTALTAGMRVREDEAYSQMGLTPPGDGDPVIEPPQSAALLAGLGGPAVGGTPPALLAQQHREEMEDEQEEVEIEEDVT